jgi:hypothetical protein
MASSRVSEYDVCDRKIKKEIIIKNNSLLLMLLFTNKPPLSKLLFYIEN